DEISAIHRENGIALFATRYDAQGVSMCEAAMSGLAVVSSTNEAIAEFIPDEGTLCPTEDYVKYADAIERLYNDPEYFSKLSSDCNKKVNTLCCFEQTIAKEIEMIKTARDTSVQIGEKAVAAAGEKILSVIIPSYNVSAYLYHGVYTIMEQENRDKIEIIIVNDGSKDNTLEIARKLQERYTKKNVIIIDKENGGHGSTINAGLKIASGKYIRILDGDDWVNTVDMKKLIDILEHEDSHIVLTDYSEDRAVENMSISRCIYNFMVPGKKYKFDDLCYEGYGFSQWGPILATSNIRSDVIKDVFTLSERCFYIDMEFDAYCISKAETITYYPLNIYRYFIGRTDQSISESSYKRNFKQHETVLFHLIDFYETSDLSSNKKGYILNKLIVPMLIAHYTILIEYLRSSKEYRQFEKKLSQYPQIYNDPRIATRMKKLHRKTSGIFVRYNKTIKRLAGKIA
ncbi:MAG: glycosyltransferase, partial [Oscillospiraceae bacterium]|nr:glycosyltransferase [Oscillospiraceae bacterium]